MPGPSIVVISGNLSRPSRTRVLVETIAASVARRIAGSFTHYELVEIAPHILSALGRDQLDSEGREVIRAVEAADLLIVGTPVYRGSYTGALKHLFDLVHFQALTGTPVILAATGGSALHGLVTEHELRPLFGFFNALTVPTAIYATEADFESYRLVSAAVTERIDRASAEAARLISTSSRSATPVAAVA